MTITSRGAVLWAQGPYSVEEIEWAPPAQGEVHVRVVAAGLCHSDHHVQTGVFPGQLPMLAGHEGAGRVVSVGEGVEGMAAGDHVVFSFVPSCGVCRMCATGHQNLCDSGAYTLRDAKPRARVGDRYLQQNSQVGSFSSDVVVSERSLVRIYDHVPLKVAALLSCGVTTGWGAMVYAGEAGVGDTVVVAGCGGLGSAAIQAGRAVGARYVVAIDPAPFKREQALTFGATHVSESMEAAGPLIEDLTWGRGADVAVLTVDTIDEDSVQLALNLVGKRGRVIPVAAANTKGIKLDFLNLGMWEKQIRGTCFGSANPQFDIPRLLDRYLAGQLQLDEMITRTYSLDEINEGYEDLLNGKNIRGLLVFE